MTHAEAVQAAKDALVEAACAAEFPVDATPAQHHDLTRARFHACARYRALLAATCPICKGTDQEFRVNTSKGMGGGYTMWLSCSHCDNGRRRDEA